MKVKLLIRNGQVVFPHEGILRADIGVKEGKIVGIYSDIENVEAERVIDIGGKFILPGMIDPHMHIGMGSNIENEYQSESRSAAIGGITTMISFTNCTDSYHDHYQYEKKIGEEKSLVDFSLHFGLMNEIHLKEIPKYIEEFGITSFKIYMNFRGDEGKYMGIDGIDDGFMYDCFITLSKYPSSCAVIHAENIEVGWRLRKKLIAEGRNDLKAWNDSKPGFIETEAIQRAIFYGAVAECQIYIAHLTTKDGLDLIRKNKVENKKVFCETCPHYLTFNTYSEIGILGKVNPPLREQSDLEALWAGLNDGTIDSISSDHVARKREKKIGTIWTAAAGFPGVGTILPILLSEGVNKRRLKIERIAEMNCKTARIFNLYPRKGTIRIGSDADFTIIDLALDKKVKAEDLKSGSDYSLYESWDLKGWPIMTIVRGEVIMDHGEIVGKPGYGVFLDRNITKNITD